MKTIKLRVDDLMKQQKFQFRVTTDQGVVDRYVEAFIAGAEFPPVDVFEIEGVQFPVDGFHRLGMYQKLNKSKEYRGKCHEVECSVREGTITEALDFALEANTRHGLLLSAEDKANQVKRLFVIDPTWLGKSSRTIAKYIGVVSDKFVEKYRPSTADGPQLRDGADGKKRPSPSPKKPKSASEPKTAAMKPTPPVSPKGQAKDLESKTNIAAAELMTGTAPGVLSQDVPTVHGKVYDVIVLGSSQLAQVDEMLSRLSPNGVLLLESYPGSLAEHLRSFGHATESLGVVCVLEAVESDVQKWTPVLVFVKPGANHGVVLPSYVMSREKFLLEFLDMTKLDGTVLLGETKFECPDDQDGIMFFRTDSLTDGSLKKAA